MRTTVTLDPDTEQILRRRMRESGASFKEALNELVRRGAGVGGGAAPFVTAPAAMGTPVVSLDRALQLAADLEDDELLSRLRSRS